MSDKELEPDEELTIETSVHLCFQGDTWLWGYNACAYRSGLQTLASPVQAPPPFSRLARLARRCAPDGGIHGQRPVIPALQAATQRRPRGLSICKSTVPLYWLVVRTTQEPRHQSKRAITSKPRSTPVMPLTRILTGTWKEKPPFGGGCGTACKFFSMHGFVPPPLPPPPLPRALPFSQ